MSLICFTMMDDHHCLDQTNATLSNSSKASLNSAFFNRSSSVSFILSSPRPCILKTSSNVCIPCYKITRNYLTQFWAPLLLWRPQLSLSLFLKSFLLMADCPILYPQHFSRIKKIKNVLEGISGWCVASFKSRGSKTWYTVSRGNLASEKKELA